MSSSSEIRSLVFGVVGLSLVGGAYVAFKLIAPPEATTDAVVAVSAEPAPLAPTPAAPTPSPTPTPAPTPVEIAVAPPVPTPVEAVEPSGSVAPDAPVAPADPMAVYSGTHKLGVNRITDMARVGNATFSRRNGELFLQARVQRGAHWLELSGTVQPNGPKEFTLQGKLNGVPDMAWNSEAPRERVTEGRFTFRVKGNRPYWRLYEVNGRDCVCWENCGNDFCYIDIERDPTGE